MSFSPLTDYIKISPNKTAPRNHAIDTFTPHVIVGQCSVQRIGEIFASPSRQASCNYGIASDGKKAGIVDEEHRSWCSSNKANDHRAITFEIASNTTHPYAITDAAFQGLIDLMVDICKRYGKKKVLWFGDKEKTLAYAPKNDEMVITVHRWFANKACPGDYLYNRLGKVASKVTALLNEPEKEESTMKPAEVADWAKTAWEKAKTKKGVDGTPIMDGSRPWDTITRQEVAVILDRLGLLD